MHKIFFATNLEFLRKRKRLTQNALGEKVGFNQKKVNSLESGLVKSPKTEDLLTLADFFKVSIDTLLRVDLQHIPELKLRELEAGNDIYLSGSGLRVLAITVDKEDNENVEYIPIKAKAGYLAGYNDPEFIARLPKVSLPFLPRSGSYRMFPTSGDSMLPFPEGCDVMCQFIEDWRKLKPQTICIVILKEGQDFLFKQVTLHADGLLLESLNKSYEPYIVPFYQIAELWQYYSHYTTEVPEVKNPEYISALLNEIHADIKILKEKHK